MPDPYTVAMALIQLAIQLIGHEKAAEIVSQAAIREADLAANAIEAARFGGR